jgi:hypothetical protein
MVHAAQPAKTTLFAGGLRSNVRKTAAGRFSNLLGRLKVFAQAGILGASHENPGTEHRAHYLPGFR